jgi:hypothetical protein
MSTTPDTNTSINTSTNDKCVIHESCNNPDLTCGFMSGIRGSLPVDKNGNPDPNCNAQCGILSKKCISSDKLKEKMAKMKKMPPSSSTNGEPTTEPTTTTSSMNEMKPEYNSNEFNPNPNMPQQSQSNMYPPKPMGGKKSLKKMKKGGKSNKKKNKTKKSGKKSKSLKKHKKI